MEQFIKKVVKKMVPLKTIKKGRLIKSLLLNEIRYLELHLCDHCNLNCKGCLHYSPLSKEVFTTLDSYTKDMTRLSELFTSVRVIRLMGGEPLLHKDITRFFHITRAVFPKTDIRLVTNGLLLNDMSSFFWEACREYGVSIDISLYPPLAHQVEHLTEKSLSEGIPFTILPKGEFSSRCNVDGDSDKVKTFNECGIGFYNIYLENGRLYNCSMGALTRYFNDAFSFDIPIEQGVDIHDPSMCSTQILQELSQPTDRCKWCINISNAFEWSVSKNERSEWIAI